MQHVMPVWLCVSNECYSVGWDAHVGAVLGAIAPVVEVTTVALYGPTMSSVRILLATKHVHGH